MMPTTSIGFVKLGFRLLLGVFFVTAGIFHFIHTSFYLKIMPSYLPLHLELVYISGVFEILGGVGVMIPALQRSAGYGLVALLIAVFPANINMAVNNIQIDGIAIAPALLWLRLPLQLVLIWWVWWCAELSSSNKSV
jgi:uncharacterized membrane protein